MPLVKEVLVGNYFALGAKISQETFVVIWYGIDPKYFSMMIRDWWTLITY
jgi:hypothetical protein